MSFLQRKSTTPEPEQSLRHRYEPPVWRKPEGKDTDEICAVCGGAWTGEWDGGTTIGNEIVHRPRYEGGFVWYTPPTYHKHPNEARYAITYRCRCVIGSKRAQEIPVAPDWLWRKILAMPSRHGKSCHVDEGPRPQLLEAAVPTTAVEIKTP